MRHLDTDGREKERKKGQKLAKKNHFRRTTKYPTAEEPTTQHSVGPSFHSPPRHTTKMAATALNLDFLDLEEDRETKKTVMEHEALDMDRFPLPAGNVRAASSPLYASIRLCVAVLHWPVQQTSLIHKNKSSLELFLAIPSKRVLLSRSRCYTEQPPFHLSFRAALLSL